MIRSSKLSLKFSNKEKLNNLNKFVDEYTKAVIFYADILWGQEKIKSLLPKEIISLLNNSWLSERAKQCAGKQASGIVRGCRKKQEKRLWKINDFHEKGMFKKERKLQQIYNKIQVGKPVLNNICPELDERFVKQDFNSETCFNGWASLTSLGNKMKIVIPVKKTKHFNLLHTKGNLLKGVRLSKKDITFNFEIEETKLKEEGTVLGIDIGKTTAISCSNGVISKEDLHGWTLDKIINKMSKQKKGSKAFFRSQTHRKNHVNWTVNQLNFNGIKTLNIENIKHLRKGKRNSRKLSHWTYTEIFDKLKDKCLELGVQVKELSPTYTSQRCSVCGWVRKANRTGKLFKCTSCGHTEDADLNASKNLAFNLPAISKEVRLKQKNRTGFYWNVLCQESIVPDAQKEPLYKLI